MLTISVSISSLQVLSTSSKPVFNQHRGIRVRVRVAVISNLDAFDPGQWKVHEEAHNSDLIAILLGNSHPWRTYHPSENTPRVQIATKQSLNRRPTQQDNKPAISVSGVAQ